MSSERGKVSMQSCTCMYQLCDNLISFLTTILHIIVLAKLSDLCREFGLMDTFKLECCQLGTLYGCLMRGRG